LEKHQQSSITIAKRGPAIKMSSVIEPLSYELECTSLQIDEIKEISTRDENGNKDQKFPITAAKHSPPTPPPTPPLIPPPKKLSEFKWSVQADPKLQHFTRNFILWKVTNKEKEAGQAQARYIDRPRIRKLKCRSFSKSVEQLNSSESDGLALALQLFNDNGTIKKSHKLHPWGDELNKGAILILGYLLVEKEFRRQGVARELIEALIEKPRHSKSGVEFMFVKPGVIKPDFEEEQAQKSVDEREKIEQREYDNAVRFYRSVGFRRVGYTKWLCLAVDAEHVSHRIALEDDLDPPVKEF
jgi:GNAT superfamily N-acetyltransferase